MAFVDLRARHLGWVEAHLRMENSDLPELWLTGQYHYRTSGFAFIVVHGVENDTIRRRSIRSISCEILGKLGYAVQLQPGRDVFNIEPERWTSKHELMEALTELNAYIDS